MLIYKIFRADEQAAFEAAGKTLGAPIDLADGYVHLSAADQVKETCAKYFAGVEGLFLLAVETERLGGDLKWEVSRGGAKFPHLYRELRADDVIWTKPLPLGPDGHVFPDIVQNGSLVKPFPDPEAFILARLEARPVPDIPEITIRQSGPTTGLGEYYENLYSDVSAAPYWAFVWGGGIGLAQYVLQYPHTVLNKRVIDIGSGSGLAAIASLKAGASHVIANDIDEIALVAAKVNARDNGVELETSAADLSKGGVCEADILLVGDVFYDQETAQRILRFLKVCRVAGIEVLIGDPGRQFLPTADIEEVAAYQGADVGTGPGTSTNRVYRLR